MGKEKDLGMDGSVPGVLGIRKTSVTKAQTEVYEYYVNGGKKTSVGFEMRRVTVWKDRLTKERQDRSR